MKTKRIRRMLAFLIIVASGLLLLQSAALWREFRLRIHFERIISGTVVEYRHRETGIVFVEIPPESGEAVDGGSLFMARREVSQSAWLHVMGGRPSAHMGSDLPVENISWIEAMEFCQRTGLSLPSEAEWQRACGSPSDDPSSVDPELLAYLGWFDPASGGAAHAVAEKSPNSSGLYDMIGNVAEWCIEDHEDGTGKVVRGGSWASPLDEVGCRARGALYAESRDDTVGFRPVWHLE